MTESVLQNERLRVEVLLRAKKESVTKRGGKCIQTMN